MKVLILSLTVVFGVMMFSVVNDVEAGWSYTHSRYEPTNDAHLHAVMIEIYDIVENCNNYTKEVYLHDNVTLTNRKVLQQFSDYYIYSGSFAIDYNHDHMISGYSEPAWGTAGENFRLNDYYNLTVGNHSIGVHNYKMNTDDRKIYLNWMNPESTKIYACYMDLIVKDWDRKQHTQKLSELQSRYDALESEHIINLNHTAKLETKKEKKTELKNQWKERFQVCKDERKELRTELDTLQSQHTNNTEYMKTLQQSYNNLFTISTESQTTIERLTTELSDIQSRYQILNTNHTEALFTIEKLTTELNEAKKQIEELES